MNYLIKPLESYHQRSAFSCGKKLLDNYIIRQARQDMKRRVSVVFVMTANKNDNEVIGYYSLSNYGIDRDIVPVELAKKMPPSYKSLPATLLGRLAVDKKHHGKKLGEKLLIDALKRSADISKKGIGSFAIIVDPLDTDAVAFYKQYGFILLPDRGRMFLPMKTIEQLF